MKENEIDDLFRSNANYLADQPHRDFNADAFWQQLQPAMPVKATRKKKAAWGYLAAASVLLAFVMGGVWWIKPAAPAIDSATAPKRVQPSGPTNSTPPVHAPTDQTAQEMLAITRTPEKRAPKKKSDVDVPAPALQAGPPASAREENIVAVANAPLSEAPALKKLDSLTGTSTAPQPPKYRIVHHNELNRQQEAETKARTQMVLRIGLPNTGSGPADSETRNPLAISIPN